MPTHTEHTWNPCILNSSPLYWPLRPYAQKFMSAHTNWPSLNDYQHFLNQDLGHCYSNSGAQLHFVPQDEKTEHISAAYEPRIYLNGEIQTRLHNWHDFFQVLVWRIFPNTKAILNQLHYDAIMQRQADIPHGTKLPSQRTRVENALTQFDECGAIILSSDKKLLQLINDFEWKTLFLDYREALSTNLKCIVFGHAVYEKAISPYLGLTTHSVLLQVDQPLLQQPTPEIMRIADKLTYQQLKQPGTITSPQSLSPFPLLGMPEWLPENSQPSFYDNTHYFRPGRQTRK